MALSTVSAVLTRIGLGKLCRLEPPEPPNRYERRHAGRAASTSTSRSSARIQRRRASRHRPPRSQQRQPRARRRGAPTGWEFVHVCVDDATRLAYVEVLADEKATTAVGFLRRAVAFYAATASRSSG